MSDVNVQLHQHYLHYSELPYSMRVLYTAALLVLGLGYLFALIYLYHTYAGRVEAIRRFWPIRISSWHIPVAGRARASNRHCAVRCRPCCLRTRRKR
jgi:hypothetical protein